MFRLVDETTLDRIHGGLLRAREFQTQASSMWWNILGVLFVIVSFGFFLYARVRTPTEEVKRIDFEPTVWYSASRGLTSDETAGQRQPSTFDVGLPSLERDAGVPV